MANNASRRARERRMRARYRRKIFFTGLIMLLIGAIACYVLVAMDYIPAWDKVGMKFDELTGNETSPAPTVTPVPMTTAEIVEITGLAEVELTSEATAEPTAVPTAEPTAEPTAVPTAEPTAVPTAVPTEAPVVSEEAAAAEADTAALNTLVDSLMDSLQEAAQTSASEDTIAGGADASAAAAEPEQAAPALNIVQGGEAVPVAATEVPAAATEVPAAATPAVVIVSTPEPTEEPAAEPVIVPYGEALTFDTQIMADGTARRTAGDEDYETLNLTLTVDAYKDPEYFEANYSNTYNLQGTEAAVEFGLTLNGYTGSAEIIPQNFLLITFVGKDEMTATQGYQLMDKEIGGATGIAITSDTPATLYKRYPFNADQGAMEYMVVTAYNEGEPSVYWFEIHDPNPQATSAPLTEGLTVGSRGAEVTKLQSKLIELNLLQGVPDGVYGNYTAEAVKEMQRRYGMEQTGVADSAFLEQLYN